MAGLWKDAKETWRLADKKVVTELLRAADHFGADRLELVSMFETAIVESGLHAIDYGDRDSVGPFQQRAGWGSKADRIDPYKSALAYLTEARRVRKRFTTAGKLAYGVQRCAYAYRNRYSEALSAARYAIEQGKALRSHAAPKPTVAAKVVAKVAPKPAPAKVKELSLQVKKSLAWWAKESAHPTRYRYNECLRTVRISDDCPGGTDWAIHVWTNAKPENKFGAKGEIPPVGAPYIFRTNAKYGHIVTVYKQGKTLNDTQVWSTDIKRKGKVDLTTIGTLRRKWGCIPMGWVNKLNGKPIDL